MNEFFLSIGSNVEPEKHVPACIQLLEQRLGLKRNSSIYKTAPMGPAGDQYFWNSVASVETELSKEALGKVLRDIESDLGRKRDPENRFAPRTIDIDILPQEDFQTMAFIMVPLAEIHPEGTDEETGKTFAELASECAQGKELIEKVALNQK